MYYDVHHHYCVTYSCFTVPVLCVLTPVSQNPNTVIHGRLIYTSMKLSFHLCVCMCKNTPHIHMFAPLQKQEKEVGSHGAKFTGCCDRLNKEAEN